MHDFLEQCSNAPKIAQTIHYLTIKNGNSPETKTTPESRSPKKPPNRHKVTKHRPHTKRQRVNSNSRANRANPVRMQPKNAPQRAVWNCQLNISFTGSGQTQQTSVLSGSVKRNTPIEWRRSSSEEKATASKFSTITESVVFCRLSMSPLYMKNSQLIMARKEKANAVPIKTSNRTCKTREQVSVESSTARYLVPMDCWTSRRFISASLSVAGTTCSFYLSPRRHLLDTT